MDDEFLPITDEGETFITWNDYCKAEVRKSSDARWLLQTCFPSKSPMSAMYGSYIEALVAALGCCSGMPDHVMLDMDTQEELDLSECSDKADIVMAITDVDFETLQSVKGADQLK